MHQLEPHYGWLKYYSAETDPFSPFRDEEHNEFFYDRQVYQYLAHPQWDVIDSEGLLVKILFVDYERSFAVIELFGVWNDLLQNDFKLLVDNCLSILVDNGVTQYVFVMENILNIYLETDDYYQSFSEDIEDGWICLLRAREHVLREMEAYDITDYFFWSGELDDLAWRKLKPLQLLQKVQERLLPLLGN